MRRRRILREGAAGKLVSELHDQLAPFIDRLGQDDLVAFEKERQASAYGLATSKIVSILQREAGLNQSGVFDAPTADAIGRLKPAVTTATMRISGRVVDQWGAGVADCRILLEAVGLAGRTGHIGETFSNFAGAYALTIDAEQSARLRRSSGLRVAAMRGERRLTATRVLISPPDFVEGLDLVTKADDGSITDFGTVREAVEVALKHSGLSIGELVETEERPDLSLLAAEIRIPVEKLQLLASATKIAAETKGAIPAELTYGLGGVGVSLATLAITGADAGVMAAHIERAVELGLVSRETQAQVDAAAAMIRTQAQTAALRALSESSLGRIVDEVGAGAAKERFFAFAADYRGEPSEFWTALEKEPTLAKARPALEFAFSAAGITGAHPGLIRRIAKEVDERAPGDLSVIAEFGLDYWADLLAQEKVAPDELGADADEAALESARRALGRGIMRATEARYPARFAAHRVKASKLPGAASIAELLGKHPELGLRSTNIRAFLRETPDAASKLEREKAIPTLLALGRIVRVAGRIEPALAIVEAGLISAQAIAAQGPRAFAMTYAAAAGGPAAALQIHVTAQTAALAAAELYLQATPVSAGLAPVAGGGAGATALPAFPDWQTLFSDAGGCDCDPCQSVVSPSSYFVDLMRFLRNRATQTSFTGSALDVLIRQERRPDLQDIELTCANTETVLPYIDLVNEILEDAVAPLPSFSVRTLSGALQTEPGSTLLTTSARSDMNNVLGLTGANAAFAIGPGASARMTSESGPWQVADPAWRIEDALATYAVKTVTGGSLEVRNRLRSTAGSTAERRLAPQYVNAEAYRRLGLAYYPWDLPFERGRVAARLAVAERGSTLADVLGTFAPGDAQARADFRATLLERLGLSETSAALVIWPGAPPSGQAALDFDKPWRHWGIAEETVSAAAPVPDPGDVTAEITTTQLWWKLLGSRLDVLLNRGQLTIDRILELLDTRWVNPVVGTARKLRLVSTDTSDPASCEPRSLSLAGFDADTAKRLARIERLVRRSGLSPREIDVALTALQHGDLNEAALFDLARLKVLRDTHDLDWLELTACFIPEGSEMLLAEHWAPIGHLRRINRTAHGMALAPTLYETVFRQRALSGPGEPWFPVEPKALEGRPLASGFGQIAAALATDVANLETLATALMPSGIGDASLAKIAVLHRHCLVARISGLSTIDYLRARRLFGATAFASPRALATFLGAIQRSAASGFSLEELERLVFGPPVPAMSDIQSDDTQALDTLRVGLRAAIENNQFIETSADGTPTQDPDGKLLKSKLVALGLAPPLVEVAGAALSDTTLRTVAAPNLPVIDPNALRIPVVERPLVSLPAGIDLAAATAGKLSYVSASGVLRAVDLLTVEDRARLVAATADETFLGVVADIGILQQDLAGRAHLDTASGRLSFRGLMPRIWEDHLKSLSTALAWRTTVEQLRDAPREDLRLVLAAWRFAPTHEPLAALPIKLPATLASRLWHDRSGAEARLVLVGPLLPDERGALLAAAAGADPAMAAFRSALETLANAANAAVRATTGDSALIPSANLDQLLDDAITATERNRRLLARVMPKAAAVQSRRVLTQHFAARTLLPSSVVERLLAIDLVEDPPSTPLKPTPQDLLLDPAFVMSEPRARPTPTAFPEQHRVMRLIAQAVLVITRCRLTTADLENIRLLDGAARLCKLPTEPHGSGPTAMTAGNILELADYREVAAMLPDGRAAASAALTAAQGQLAALPTALAAAYGRDPQLMSALLGSSMFNVTDASNFLFASALRDLGRALQMIDASGLSASILNQVRAPSIDQAAGRAVLNAVGALSSPSEWRERGRALMDAIRVQSRDALTAYLLARGRPAENGLPAARWRNTLELFGHFLIDTEMGPCMETSRLRQAISSVQLFIQRCRLGLEPQVRADADVVDNVDDDVDDGWLQIEWMQNQSVWGANRMVYLFPENLLRTDLLDVKSPLLKEAEADLGKGEPTLESAARAALGYLDKLKDIANLRPVAVSHEATHSTLITHVIGRRDGDPPEHFHRRRDYTGVWSPWQPVALEIRSDHVMLHVWNRRVFLFWMNVVEKAENARSTDGKSITYTTTQEFKLCWSELRDGVWSPQRQSQEVCLSTTETPIREHAFRLLELTDGALEIFLQRFMSPDVKKKFPLPTYGFRIAYPHAEPRAFRTRRLPVRVAPAPGGGYRTSGQLVEPLTGALQLPHKNAMTERALGSISKRVEIAHSPDHALRDWSQQPFFMRDKWRSFFVTPTRRTVFPPITGRHFDFQDWITIKPKAPKVRPEFDIASVYPPKGPRPNWGEAVINPVYQFNNPLEGQRPSITAEWSPEIEQDFVFIERASRTFALGMHDAGSVELRNQLKLADTYGTDHLEFIAGEMAQMRGIALREAEGIGSGLMQVKSAQVIPSNSSYGAADVRPLTSITSIWTGNVWVPSYQEQTYGFQPFYHPYVDALIDVTLRRGVEGLFRRDVQLRPYLYLPRQPQQLIPYATTYAANAAVVSWSEPTESMNFDYDAAYAVYNWELFYHLPMLAVERLAKARRFDDALQFLHMIFDPRDQSATATLDDGSVIPLGAARYWQTKPFFMNAVPQSGLAQTDDTVIERERIERILRVLALAAAPGGTAQLTAQEHRDLGQFRSQVEEMRRKPFRPHAIARLRTSAYQRAVVMKYIEILVDWGDMLFRRDTMESINAATQLYVMAASFRVPDVGTMPARAVAEPQTYRSLAARLDEGSNALVEIEGYVAPSAPPGPGSTAPPPPALLAFCVPRNEKLQRLWDRIGDRLFKIHNCLDIDGRKRRLALFEPPIDPELLASAVAAGVDISAAIADLDGPAPGRRFRVMIRQAQELAQEVKALGAGLLSAIEKRDSEMLAQLRARHERQLLERGKDLRDKQVAEAEASIESMRAQRRIALERYNHNRRLLRSPGSSEPAEGAAIPLLPARTDTATQPSQVFKLVADLIAAIPGASKPPGTELDNIPVTGYEDFELAMNTVSQGLQLRSSAFEVLSGIFNVIPNFNIEPFGVGATFGGSNLGSAASAGAAAFRGLSGAAGFIGQMASRASQFAMRADDWIHQQNLAALEIMQIDRQILAAKLRVQITTRERDNHIAQTEDSREMEAAITSKESNVALYEWMVDKLVSLHEEAYNLAFDVAKRAQSAARRELQQPRLSVIGSAAWNDGRRGLLAGETLSADLRRLEVLYDEMDAREDEMVKHVSLAQTDPGALIRFRETGTATFSIPEALFDLDAPGQYMRRIKKVALTIPAVAGPYTGVHTRLTLLRSMIRIAPTLTGAKRLYARDAAREDSRFLDLNGPVQSIMTSSGQNDTGLFEAPLEDPRYLPFEGAGAVSEWKLDRPRLFRTLDDDSISDVILTIHYRARDGGDALRQQVETELQTALNAQRTASDDGLGLARIFSLRQETPTEWRRFLEAPGGENIIDLPILRERLPFFVERRPVRIIGVSFVAKLEPDFVADLQTKLDANLLVPSIAAAVPLAFSRMAGRQSGATWTSAAGVLLPPPAAGQSAPPKWRLTMRVKDAQPRAVPAEALKDVHVVVRYRLG